MELAGGLSEVHESPEYRLRRLDALFAEKVCGLAPEPGSCMCGGPHPCENYNCTCWAGYGCLGYQVPPYTRSLDAAWGAACSVPSGRPDLDLDLTLAFPRPGDPPFAAAFTDGYGFTAHLSRASHPAEALVLACLRAVGVPESELG